MTTQHAPVLVGRHRVGTVHLTRTPAGAIVVAVAPSAARALAEEILAAVARQEAGQ